MKNDYLTKALLIVIAFTLTMLVGERWFMPAKVVSAAPTRVWEYKYIEMLYRFKGRSLMDATMDLDTEDCYDGTEKITCAGMSNRMGAQGWELIGVVPESRIGNNPAWAGTTTAVTYVFKR